MGTPPDSSRALGELRHLLLEPETLTDAVEPLMDELLRERSTEIANTLIERLTPTIRLAIREALHEEVRNLSAKRVHSPALAITSSVSHIFRQRLGTQPEKAGALPLPTQVATERPVAGQVASPLLEEETTPKALPNKAQHGHQPARWRWLLGLFLAVMGLTMSSALLPALFPSPGVESQAIEGESIVGSGNAIAGRATLYSTIVEPEQSAIAGNRSLTTPTPFPLASGDSAASLAHGEGKSAAKALYLTFDDGPNPTWTPQILELLRQYDAQATFFVIGQQAARYPDLIRAEANAGHVVAHHTWSHRSLEGIERAGFEAEIQQTLDTPAGSSISPLLRPPYGTIDDEARTWAAALGLQIFTWDINPQDWEQDCTAARVSSLVIGQASPGKVVLLHDGGGDRACTVAALRAILETLGQQGYVFRALPPK